MSGSVILMTDLRGGQPRFCAASSRVSLVCWKPAAADRVGDDQQNRGINDGVEEREKLSLLRHRKVAEGEDEAGHGEGQHREEIEDLPAGDFRAHHDVGDCDAQNDVDQRGDAGEFQAVRDGGHGEVVAEGDGEVLEGVILRQDGAIPVFGERDEGDAEVGEDRDERDAAKQRGAEQGLGQR